MTAITVPARGATTAARVLALLLAAVLALSLTGCAFEEEFQIEGNWKSVGEDSWGVVSKGSAVTFTGEHTNLYSPLDTYVLYTEGEDVKLTVTGMMGGDTTFTVNIVDDDNIELTQQGEVVLALKRVS